MDFSDPMLIHDEGDLTAYLEFGITGYPKLTIALPDGTTVEHTPKPSDNVHTVRQIINDVYATWKCERVKRGFRSKAWSIRRRNMRRTGRILVNQPEVIS